MKINLKEIPEEGFDYILNRKTAELNQALKDLIDNNEYNVKAFIKPLNTKNYSLSGSIQTEKLDICSTCGDQFKFPIKTNFNEILIPSAQEVKNAQFAKSNHVSELRDDGPGVSEYSGDHFDLGEFIHEAIGLSIPFNPKHSTGDVNCQPILKSESPDIFIYDEKMDIEKKKSAFDALKSLKLN